MGVRYIFGQDGAFRTEPVIVAKNITENGTYDPATDNADGYAPVTVNVEGGGGEPDLYYNITINAAPEILDEIYFGRNYAVNNYHSMINNEEIEDSEIVIDLSEGVTNLQLKLHLTHLVPQLLLVAIFHYPLTLFLV